MKLALILCFSVVYTKSSDVPCSPKYFATDKIACVCNATYCDTVSPPAKLKEGSYYLYTSNKDGLRFQKSSGQFDDTYRGSYDLLVDKQKTYQEIFGFGGALTDAVGINTLSLEESAQENLLNSYFSKSGIEYSLCRIPIGGTDFSTRGYSYDETENDYNLTNFKLADEDFKYKIPFIKKMKAITEENIKFFASVWIAPKWMKTNHEYNGIGFLKSEAYAAWANYILKFFQLYKSEGIEFWGLTTQNEPSLSFIPTFISKIPSIGWLPNQMIEFVTKHLGPTLKNSEFSDLKIMCFDDQRILLKWTVDKLFANEEFKNIVDGIAYHWYYNKISSASVLTDMHNKHPEKFILSTEACVGDKFWQESIDLGSWDRGENYYKDIIENMQNWVSGWIDWSMALDLSGGPTYIDNFVDSPIIVNAEKGEFYKQPMFYAMGHFSKFVPPNSRRISTEMTTVKNVQTTGFIRPDGATILQIFNGNDKTINLRIVDKFRGKMIVNVTKRSFNTVVYW